MSIGLDGVAVDSAGDTPAISEAERNRMARSMLGMGIVALVLALTGMFIPVFGFFMLIAAGGGNMVAAGGGNLIGLDGSTLVNRLVGNDGASIRGLSGMSMRP